MSDEHDYSVYATLAAAYAQTGARVRALEAAANVRRLWPFFTVSNFVARFQDAYDRQKLSEGLTKAGLE